MHFLFNNNRYYIWNVLPFQLHEYQPSQVHTYQPYQVHYIWNVLPGIWLWGSSSILIVSGARAPKMLAKLKNTNHPRYMIEWVICLSVRFGLNIDACFSALSFIRLTSSLSFADDNNEFWTSSRAVFKKLLSSDSTASRLFPYLICLSCTEQRSERLGIFA